MKAVTWRGVNEIGVEDVPEPRILNDHDIILEVGLTATCGSDLHLMGGYIPAMRAGTCWATSSWARSPRSAPA
ncbi:hypothetical protein [Blastococcus brunescens]|uniref:Uncharacterized protein n=1 Tax=Blastococcus brunescens TaxID=1564165 RepID=A0ABZ1ATB4_9ACTN|nr:hypothetical protein [Blastococcus sp. BMG 8361]WRL61812.1 hypothetical protein U6N30_16950 [Blastococcus sp. BMG 8361]